MASRLVLDSKQIHFDLKTTGGMVDRGMVRVMTAFERSAKRHTPISSGYMRAHWDWERRAASKGLGYRLGNTADYAIYRMKGVKPKTVRGRPMAVGRTQVMGNPWPTIGRITYSRYRAGYLGKDIIKIALAETAAKMALL